MPDLNVNIKATDKTSKAFTAVKGNVNTLKGSFTKLMGPLTAVIGVAGLAGMAKQLLTVGAVSLTTLCVTFEIHTTSSFER